MVRRIRVRRGTDADWSTINPILAAGEWGYSTSDNVVKIGNGSSSWNTLGKLIKENDSPTLQRLGLGTAAPSDFGFDVLTGTSSGNRHLYTVNGGTRFQRRGDTSGWAFSYGFTTNDNLVSGGFGATGSNTAINYYYIGTDLNDTMFRATPSNGFIGLGLAVTATERLDVNGNVRIRSLTTSAGDFVTASATGVLSRRTAAQTLSDIGAAPASGSSNYLNLGNSSDLQALTASRAGFTNVGVNGNPTVGNTFAYIKLYSSTINNATLAIATGGSGYPGNIWIRNRDDSTWHRIYTTNQFIISDYSTTAVNNTLYAPISGSANYIQNQSAGAQSSSNAWVSGFLQAGNLRLTGNTLSSQDTNGNIIASPNGSGFFQVDAIQTGSTTKGITIRNTSGWGAAINWDIGAYQTARIYSQNESTGGRLYFMTADTTGTLQNRWFITNTGILQSEGSQTIRTSTGNLILATNGGNGNIEITPNGTGETFFRNNAIIRTTGTVTGSFGRRIYGMSGGWARTVVFGTSEEEVGSIMILGMYGNPISQIGYLGSTIADDPRTGNGLKWSPSNAWKIGGTTNNDSQFKGTGTLNVINGIYSGYVESYGSASGGLTGLAVRESSFPTDRYISIGSGGIQQFRQSTSIAKFRIITTNAGSWGVGGGGIDFEPRDTLRWSILGADGVLEANGAQTIRTSTGNLTLATNDGNGNIILSLHGTGKVVYNAPTDNALTTALFLNGSNEIHRRALGTGAFATIADYLTISAAASTYEPAFSKNTAFNKNFGTTAGTVAEGNDSRILNGQTAFGWGNHASAGYAVKAGNNSFTGDNDFTGEVYIDSLIFALGAASTTPMYMIDAYIDYSTSTISTSPGASTIWANAANSNKLMYGSDGIALENRSIATQHSLTGGGNLTSDRTLSLVNDVASPGNNKVYGTNGSGVRGWYDPYNPSDNCVYASDNNSQAFSSGAVNPLKFRILDKDTLGRLSSDTTLTISAGEEWVIEVTATLVAESPTSGLNYTELTFNVSGGTISQTAQSITNHYTNGNVYIATIRNRVYFLSGGSERTITISVTDSGTGFDYIQVATLIANRKK